ncbi:pseudouridine-5'-phosphate glycosidase-like isoform X2 [Coregonus clupeaformis]|uniref:pseudouridine-5'-phosphate glycosidase-like isoform X2 n=1 Tax=Coregonus clupeaformis TaxID=59861 RepID=UPI001E1C8896|nr:pseudouridine-5'-phosphate glycosidase-like isoform X2 [Coregonus clupeaformis]
MFEFVLIVIVYCCCTCIFSRFLKNTYLLFSLDVLFRVHLSVSQALAENRPGVVLVSTIITHGMPYPHSVSTAKEVEAIVRGRVHVRLSSELDYLAQSKTSLKVSRQDLPYAISKSGLLLAVPIPEEHAAASQQIGDAIQAALAEAICLHG